MRILTPLWRSLRLLEHLVAGAAIALVVATGHRLGIPAKRLPLLVRWWHGRLCRALGLRVEVSGDLAPHALLVANHVSWLDIPVIGAQGSIGFLSKAEVRGWPLIGWMAEIAGTLFLTRGANQTAEMIPRIAERIRTVGGVVVFPEGTTTDGKRLQRFHPRLLAVGQCGGIRIQPVALRFGTNSSPDLVAPFVGDEALLPHLARLVRHSGLRVQVSFLPTLDADALPRRAVADHCGSVIARALGIEPSAPSSSLTNSMAEGVSAPAVPLAEAT
jgi:1-acyl-sn-glycerol-3-phosphate acyltransferase